MENGRYIDLDKTRQDKTRQDKTRQDKTRHLLDKDFPVLTEIRTLSTAKAEPKTYIEWEPAFRVLSITKAGKTEDYAVTEFPTTWDGRAFQLQKPCGDWYDVFVCRKGQKNTCDCAGFTYSGRCKHQDAVRHLIHNGLVGDKMEMPCDMPAETWPSQQQIEDDAANCPF